MNDKSNYTIKVIESLKQFSEDEEAIEKMIESVSKKLDAIDKDQREFLSRRGFLKFISR